MCKRGDWRGRDWSGHWKKSGKCAKKGARVKEKGKLAKARTVGTIAYIYTDKHIIF